MKSSKAAVTAVGDELRSRSKWRLRNFMYFPQALRDAIPGPELPGCDRCLVLSGIDGASVITMGGQRIRLKFRVEETGKLKGAFEVSVDLNPDAALALAATLKELTERTDSGERG